MDKKDKVLKRADILTAILVGLLVMKEAGIITGILMGIFWLHHTLVNVCIDGMTDVLHMLVGQGREEEE